MLSKIYLNCHFNVTDHEPPQKCCRAALFGCAAETKETANGGGHAFSLQSATLERSVFIFTSQLTMNTMAVCGTPQGVFLADVSSGARSAGGAPSIRSIVAATLGDAVGQEVTVDCIDGSSVTGTLASVDMKPMTSSSSIARGLDTGGIRGSNSGGGSYVNFSMTAYLQGNVVVKRPDGRNTYARDVAVMGSQIKWIRLPTAMRNAPFFAALCAEKASSLIPAPPTARAAGKRDKAKSAMKSKPKAPKKP